MYRRLRVISAGLKFIYTSYKPSEKSVRQVMDQVFFLPFMSQVRSARAIKTRKEKNENPKFALKTEQTRLIR